MESIYVWLNITAEGMPSTSKIMFIGKENKCVEWVRNATFADIKSALRAELKNGFWFRFRNGIMKCRLQAGSGETKTEKTFRVHIK